MTEKYVTVILNQTTKPKVLERKGYIWIFPFGPFAAMMFLRPEFREWIAGRCENFVS